MPEINASNEAMKLLLNTMRDACDAARIVDPATFEARTLTEDGSGLNEPYRCFSALCNDRRCENCISMRAVDENRPVSKFEFRDGDAYFITARPVEFSGKPHTLEIIQKVSNDVGLHDGLEDLREHVQEETDREFVDPFTGTYNRSYFDEGLRSLTGRKLAVLKVANLEQLNVKEGYPTGDLLMKRIAHDILANTRIEDSVVHYQSDMFLVQFEDFDSESFDNAVQHILDIASAVTIESHPHARPDIFVAAVDEDATYGELAEQALTLLEEAQERGQQLALRSSDIHHRAPSAVRDATAAETLQRGPGQEAADIDELTQLYTPSAIRLRLQQLIEKRPARSEGYCVIYLDIENFKQVNRVFGIDAGDELLQFLADRIREVFPDAIAARMTADMFVMITRQPDIADRCRQLHDMISSRKRRLALSLKAGIVALDEACHDSAAVIELARAACKSIKGHYDVVVRFYDSELDQEISMGQYVVNNIERAIEEGRIKVFFQPIVRAMTEHVCDYECLCRWDDPIHGLLPPSAFVSSLERSHLINKLDSYVVRLACEHQASLMAAGKPLLPVSVNLSRLDFQLDNFFDIVEAEVARTGIPRNMLNIEVTESALDEDTGFFAIQLEQFRSAGYEVWMDDFGSGYSSLNLLKDYRFDALKIDMEFLAGFDQNPKSREIIVTVVDMAKKLGVRTLVEGVETKQQYRFLQRIGCEMLQGYYFGQPQPYDPGAFAQHTIENARERAYFDQLGSVNLLGLPANDTDEPAGGFVTESESRSTPMAIVEYRSGWYSYLSANEGYLKLIMGIELDSLDEMQDALAQSTYRMADALVEHLDIARGNGDVTAPVHMANGELHQVQIRHIASGPDADAFAITPIAVG